MKKLLLILLSFFLMTWAAVADDEVTQHPIIDKVLNSQSAVEIGGGWVRIIIKENLSKTEFDWRFDIRVIETNGRDLLIIHREEQNSGQHPDSNWVIEHSYMDVLTDSILDQYDKERFISVQGSGGGWFRVSVTWPDNFRYPDLLTEEEAAELYKKELEWWNNKL